jgi:hypothetical protein
MSKDLERLLVRDKLDIKTCKFITVDIQRNKKSHYNPYHHQQDCFSRDFQQKHQKRFHFVFMPAMGGIWQVLQSEETDENMVRLISLIEGLLSILKPGGGLFLSGFRSKYMFLAVKRKFEGRFSLRPTRVTKTGARAITIYNDEGALKI